MRIVSGSLPQIVAVAHQHIESVELNLGIVSARVQPVEVRDAIDTQQHGFAISRRKMESPNANSSSESTQERLIVKAKRPSRKRWALQSTIHYDRNFDGLPRSQCSVAG